MNRYVPPRRRRVEPLGPAGEEPPEIEPQLVKRVMRCPHCRQVIATMRRWQMACPECGYEWEEETHLSIEDRLADASEEATQWLVMAILVGGMIAIGLLVAGAGLYAFVLLTSRVGLAGAIFAAFILVGLLLALGAWQRERMETRSRFFGWWGWGR